MTEDRKPWAYLFHKNGKLGGVTVADGRDTAKIVAGFVKDGYAITTVCSREEYDRELKALRELRKDKP